jgi:hypothetical protein
MTRRRWLLVVLAVLVLAAVAAGVTLAATRHGKVTYSVTAPGKARLKATLADSRGGKHTDWLVLHDAPQGGDRRLLNLFRDGDAGGDWRVSVSTHVPLPAGVYRYGVYSVDRLYAPDDPKYWTARYLVSEGQVTVP